MFALEEDTREYYEQLPQLLDDVEVSAILPSISIPLYGTPWYKQVEAEGRIADRDLSHYEGDHLVFQHLRMTEEAIFEAYRRVNRIFYSSRNIFRRWLRFMGQQRKMESLTQYILKLLVTTFVYFEISIFQRHHAQHRVFVPLSASKGSGVEGRVKSAVRITEKEVAV
jgi:hypothetical protein